MEDQAARFGVQVAVQCAGRVPGDQGVFLVGGLPGAGAGEFAIRRGAQKASAIVIIAGGPAALGGLGAWFAGGGLIDQEAQLALAQIQQVELGRVVDRGLEASLSLGGGLGIRQCGRGVRQEPEQLGLVAAELRWETIW